MEKAEDNFVAPKRADLYEDDSVTKLAHILCVSLFLRQSVCLSDVYLSMFLCVFFVYLIPEMVNSDE